MLELHNVRMKPSNVGKKWEPPNLTKALSNVMFELHNVTNGIIKCDKRIVTCDVETAQYDDEIVKCENLVTWYSRLPTSGYRTPKKKMGGTTYP